jgi:hypothetical protein
MRQNVFVGQKLETTTNEEVVIVKIEGDFIYVLYKNYLFKRPKSIIGQKLFFVQATKNKNETNIVKKPIVTSSKSSNSLPNKNTNELESKNSIGSPTKDISRSTTIKQETKESDGPRKSCKNCIEMRKQECVGEDTICQFYRYAPSISIAEMENWPKYGDASYYRFGKKDR